MTIGEAIHARLSSGAALVALVGDRFYPKVAPQAVLAPYVTWFRVSLVDYPGMGGTPPLFSGRYQFNAYADSEGEMLAVWEALRVSLDRWRDDAGTPKIIDSIYAGSDTASFEPQTGLFAGSIDFLIHWQE